MKSALWNQLPLKKNCCPGKSTCSVVLCGITMQLFSFNYVVKIVSVIVFIVVINSKESWPFMKEREASRID